MRHDQSISKARSFLFVPGDRPERFVKAIQSGADAVVIDLEDSVPLAHKAEARDALKKAWPDLSSMGCPLVVRVNALDQTSGQEDLRNLSSIAGLSAIMVPKADAVPALEQVRRLLPEVAILPMIESAAGYAAIDRLAQVTGVARLVLGHIDFMADTGLQCSPGEPELTPLRFAISIASRLHGLAPAVDGVTTAIAASDLLREDTWRALRFGFGAKLCIHPGQVSVVHEVLTPSVQDLDWARRVIEADATSGGAASQVDGRMVDLPVVLQARRLLARAAQH
jgi:citrate lyase subunit beta/citryl-CoA lyase